MTVESSLEGARGSVPERPTREMGAWLASQHKDVSKQECSPLLPGQAVACTQTNG